MQEPSSAPTEMTPPRKIAFCITDLDNGGAERALLELVTRLDKTRWTPRVYCLSERGELVEEFERLGIDVKCRTRSRRFDLTIIPWLTKDLKEFRPDIIQGFLFHGNIASRLAGARARIPARIAGHRVAERGRHWHLRVDRLTRRWVHHHVCVSRGVADFVTQELSLNPHEVTVIPNGVTEIAPSTPTHSIREEFGIAPEAPIVLAAGRLHPQKGFPDLLEAFRTVRETHSDVHLIIAGEGPQRQELEAQIRHLKLDGSVTLAGFRSDLTTLMQQADLFVLSSLWEGMPNVVLQAMECGLPVVATEVEGVPDVIESNLTGILVPIGAAPEIAGACLQILTDPELGRQLGSNAQNLVRKNFTWKRTASLYEQLYGRLLSDQMFNEPR
ncbi:Alpha-D-kanosaminyltransferase [Thalassoglobus neptunius]|uniref:Alpha-D-kanosaminyltransferase n=1 Tax=Thalassoglobus neptunius TaxID=1938619 RepID=A0A5C5X2J6_9PLAN|nr:glycosyltransferase [Thalassoglobus neptunius]TWT57060.1 Alpha-D-kanosaminyltransferase [Thalassoglobus neptunius]